MTAVQGVPLGSRAQKMSVGCPDVIKGCPGHAIVGCPASSCGVLTSRFRDGLVWTVGLTVELKLRFQFLLHGVDGPKKRCPGIMYIFVTNKDCITLILKR